MLPTMYLQDTVKHQRRELMQHNARHSTSALLYIYDNMSRLRFLVDTGADVSVLPALASQRSLPPALHLYAANGTKIPVYLRKTVQLDFNLGRAFEWTFYVGNVSKAILGADFLKHFNLIIDLKGQKLIDPLTNSYTAAGWTLSKLSTRFLLTRLISQKQLSSHHSDCLNMSGCHLG